MFDKKIFNKWFIYYNFSILEPKIGDCPEDPKPKTCLLKQSECQLDGQCNGKRKCCKFTCHKFCVDPDENK